MKKYSKYLNRILAFLLSIMIAVLSVYIPTFEIKPRADILSSAADIASALGFETIASFLSGAKIVLGLKDDSSDIDETYADTLMSSWDFQSSVLKSNYYKSLSSEEKEAVLAQINSLSERYTNGDITLSQMKSLYNQYIKNSENKGFDSDFFKTDGAKAGYNSYYSYAQNNGSISPNIRGYKPSTGNWGSLSSCPLYKYYNFISRDEILYTVDGYGIGSSSIGSQSQVRFSGNAITKTSDGVITQNISFYCGGYSYSGSMYVQPICIVPVVEEGENYYNGKNIKLQIWAWTSNTAVKAGSCIVYNKLENKYQIYVSNNAYLNNITDYSVSGIPVFDTKNHFIAWCRHFSEPTIEFDPSWMLNYEDYLIDGEPIVNMITTQDLLNDMDNVLGIFNGQKITFEDLISVQQRVTPKNYSSTNDYKQQVTNIYNNIVNNITNNNNTTIENNFDDSNILSALDALEEKLEGILNGVLNIPERIADALDLPLEIPDVNVELPDINIPNYTNHLEDIKNGISSLISAINGLNFDVDIPNPLDYTGILGSILAGIGNLNSTVNQFFTIDTNAIRATYNQTKPTLGNYKFIQDFKAFARDNASTFEEVVYPRIEIDTPDIVRSYLKSDKIIVYDFETHAQWYQKIRMFMQFSLYFVLIWTLIKRFTRIFGYI